MVESHENMNPSKDGLTEWKSDFGVWTRIIIDCHGALCDVRGQDDFHFALRRSLENLLLPLLEQRLDGTRTRLDMLDSTCRCRFDKGCALGKVECKGTAQICLASSPSLSRSCSCLRQPCEADTAALLVAARCEYRVKFFLRNNIA